MEQPDLKLQQAVLAAAQQAYAEKLFAGTSGNLSVYDRERGILYITPTSARYETMRAQDIVAMRLDGTVLTPPLRPSSEWQMHAIVYAARPDVQAQVHTHSPYATAFSVVRRPIPATLIEALVFLGGEIPCAGYARPGTAQVGELAAKALASGLGGCLLDNHGVLAVGADLAQALLRAEYIEDTARITALASGLGTPYVLTEL